MNERSPIQKFIDQVKIAKQLGQFVVLTVEEAEAMLQEIEAYVVDDGK